MKFSKLLTIGLLASSLLLSACGGKTEPVHEHTWGTPTYAWADDFSSCTAERICIKDTTHKETETKTPVYTIVIPAGCETEGQGLYTVTFDNSAFATQTHTITLDPTNHSWGTPIYEWSADYSQCTATRVCSYDETHVETETANSTYAIITSAKCEEDGLGRYTASFTNPAFETKTHDKILPMTNHDWNNPSYEWNTDYSQCTATRVCSNNSAHIETETVDSTYQIITPATKETEGLGRYMAVFTNISFKAQTHDEIIERLYYGEKPRIAEDGKTITYGLYPQNNVDDSDLILALDQLTNVESNGLYLYKGVYYAKTKAKIASSEYGYVFDNGTVIEYGKTYWFKCEPITWNVLSNNNGECYLLSSILIDQISRYSGNDNITIDEQTIYPNNYKYSKIRSWLNVDFYNSAFALGNDNIQTTIVDNSAATTEYRTNEYACENTEDKVFLPSYQDYINSSYGFFGKGGQSDTRYCKTTDWARARGAWYSTDSSYLYNGHYWTRSPNSGHPQEVRSVTADGRITCSWVIYSGLSVRPSISIKLS